MRQAAPTSGYGLPFTLFIIGRPAFNGEPVMIWSV